MLMQIGMQLLVMQKILNKPVISGTNTGDQDLSGLVVKNAAITGATKTKVTYDTKGLVTSEQMQLLQILQIVQIKDMSQMLT